MGERVAATYDESSANMFEPGFVDPTGRDPRRAGWDLRRLGPGQNEDDMSVFARTNRHTRCPYEGEAPIFALEVDGKRAEDAVWS